MKKNLALIIAIVAVSSLAGFSVAQAKGPENNYKAKNHSPKINIDVPKDPVNGLNQATKENENLLQNETNLAKVISGGTKLINARLNTLAQLKNSINQSKLTTEQKTNLNSMIDDNTNGLNQLKTKLATDTDLATAKADVKSIFTDYRIYGVFKPKVSSLKMLDMNQNNLDKIQSTTFTTYQAKIDALKASGGDVTLIAKMEAGLAKAKTDAAANGTLISSTITLTQNLKPADYPTTSKTTLATIKSNLKTIRNGFKMIRTDLGAKGKINVTTK